jgi:hypothetical protein
MRMVIKNSILHKYSLCQNILQYLYSVQYLPHCIKKVSDFPVPSRDVTIIKLSLAGNNNLF